MEQLTFAFVAFASPISAFLLSPVPNLESKSLRAFTPTMSSNLAEFTPCDVSDALVQFGVKNGGYIPNLVKRSALGQPRSVVGRAYTVLYAPLDDPRPAVRQSYIDEVPSSSFVVIGLPEVLQLPIAPYVTVNNALYGSLMLTRAKYRQAAGTMVLGRIRDLAEHQDLEYPVWLYGLGSAAPGPVVKVVGINLPILVKVASVNGGTESIQVNPGDYIIGDENGIVRLPVDHTSGPESQISLRKVLEYISKRTEADRKVSDDIMGGRYAAEAQKDRRSKI